jgi:hypothetical protein
MENIDHNAMIGIIMKLNFVKILQVFWLLDWFLAKVWQLAFLSEFHRLFQP